MAYIAEQNIVSNVTFPHTRSFSSVLVLFLLLPKLNCHTRDFTL